MFADFRLGQAIHMDELFGGRLERYGIREHVTEQVDRASRILTDGDNYVLVLAGEDGHVTGLSHRGGNCVGRMLEAIHEEFQIEIYSKGELQYWGFKTQEEWDAFARKLKEEFLPYIAGETDALPPSCIVSIKEVIGEMLVASYPQLGARERKDELMKAIDENWERCHHILPHAHLREWLSEPIRQAVALETGWNPGLMEKWRSKRTIN